LAQAPAQSEFRRAFSSFAQRVHRRQALRQALTGAGLGLALGALAALGLWALRLGEWRPFAASFGGLGAAAGGIAASRRRWSESDVALYLDARLGSHETLTTAIGARDASEPALALVVERASTLLGAADPARTRPRFWSPLHVIAPLSLLAIVAIARLPLPPAPQGPALSAGAEPVRIGRLQGLEPIEALAQLRGQNPEQDARLKGLAEQARKLRDHLARGLEKREALSEIAKLRDGIAAERLKLGDQENRPGLDAAVRAFGTDKALKNAQNALGNGDLTAFDDEMQKLANRVESADRQAAKDALEEAAKAARDTGAKSLADALDSQRRLFERRQAHADALREFAQSMKGKLSAEAESDLKEFGSSGSPQTEQRLEEGLERALEGLSPEERQRLAERMQRQLQADDGASTPMTKKQLVDLAKKLASDDGLEALEKQLRELAKPEPSDDAEREQALGDADRGGSAAERGLGAVPIPMSTDDAPAGPGDASGSPEKAGSANGAGAGSEHDKGAGDHSGRTPEIAGNELRSKAEAHLQAGAPMHGATLGRAPARAGETANELGTGRLGNVDTRQTEVGAVDHADIPEEYREQVGRYFEP
jgi:hypothetical protein